MEIPKSVSSFADADECRLDIAACTCDGLTGCTPVCTDNPAGSYTCGCSVGFELDADGFTCIGEQCCV